MIFGIARYLSRNLLTVSLETDTCKPFVLFAFCNLQNDRSSEVEGEPCYMGHGPWESKEASLFRISIQFYTGHEHDD